MATNDHGSCPACGVSLTGGNIWAHFFQDALDMGLSSDGAQAEADRAAEMYGATREVGTWGRAIGIYDLGSDRTVSWLCPDCGHEWSRN